MKRGRGRQTRREERATGTNTLRSSVTPAPTPVAATQRALRPIVVAVLGALVVLTVVAYAPVWRFDFVSLDDHVYVARNPFVQAGFTSSSLRQVFTSSYANFWHPLTMLSLMVDARLFGLAPGAFHATNLMLHVLATILLFLVLRKATGRVAPSAFVAAFFAVHPLHVESVAWISQRKDVLSTVFWMLTTWAYVAYAQTRHRSYYLLALGFFALGLTAKPMLVTLPFVLLLLDVWPLGRVELRRDPLKPGGWPILSRAWLGLAVEKLPFVVLSIGASVVAFVAQQRGGAVATAAGFSLAGRVANALTSCVTYVAKTAWPHALTVFYPYPQSPRTYAALGAAVLLAAITIAAVRLVTSRPYLAVGWFWYLGTLVPVLGLVQVGSHAMADRYTYVPLIGLFIAVAWGAADLTGPASGGSERAWWSARSGHRVVAVSGIGAIAVIACVAITRAQVMTWRDSAALWGHALEVMPDNYYAHNAHGLELRKQGRDDEAAAEFLRASQLAPGFPNAEGNLGLLLADHGRFTEAIEHYREALRRAPDYQPAHDNLGNALTQAGRPQEAIAHYREALRLGPDRAGTRSNLANALMAAGREPDALIEYEEALRLDPASASTRFNYANALRRLGRADAAIREYSEALRLEPSYADARQNLGELLGQVGRTDDAVAELQAAARVAKDPAPPLADLGTVLLRAGRTAEAIAQFRAAVSASPDSAAAHMGLGTALYQSGQLQQAATEHALAVRLAPDVADTHYNFAVTLTALGRLREAAAEYQETLRLEGDSADLHLALAAVLERLGQASAAAGHYANALRLQPDLVPARDGLARVGKGGKGR